MEYQTIETAPKDGTRILIKLNYQDAPRVAAWRLYKPRMFSKLVEGAWFDGEKLITETFHTPFGSASYPADPKHWMHIPQVKETGDKEK